MCETKVVLTEDDRYMDEKTVHLLLKMGVKPEKLPFCRHPAATHAAACSAASLVARAVRANLSFLQNQIDICWAELMCEEIFSIEKLQEHIDILGALNLLLFMVTGDRLSSLETSSANENAETENILAQAFAKLPKEDFQVYSEGIADIRSKLEDEILLEMMKLRYKIKEGAEENSEEDIRLLLHIEIGPKLLKIYEQLGKVRVNVGSVVDKVRADWQANISQLRVHYHS